MEDKSIHIGMRAMFGFLDINKMASDSNKRDAPAPSSVPGLPIVSPRKRVRPSLPAHLAGAGSKGAAGRAAHTYLGAALRQLQAPPVESCREGCRCAASLQLGEGAAYLSKP